MVQCLDLSLIQTHAEATMLDTCQIGQFTTPTAPDPSATYVYGSAITCGVNLHPRGEVAVAGGVTVADAEIRLPYATEITGKDRIKVTHKFGEALGTAEVYAVLGEPKCGLLGLVCLCRRLTGASAT